MGVDYYTYIGPYLRLNTSIRTTLKNILVCPNPSCNYNQIRDGEFCNKCGTKGSLPPNIDRFLVKKAKVSSDEVYELTRGEFYNIDHYGYHRNGDIVTYIAVPSDKDDGIYFEIDGVRTVSIEQLGNIANKKIELAAKYKNSLEKLIEVFDSVILDFGVISYCDS